MKYITKLREVEAMRYTGDNYKEVHTFTGNRIYKDKCGNGLTLVTEEWNQEVRAGDWVVKFDEYQYEVFSNDEFNENFETM